MTRGARTGPPFRAPAALAPLARLLVLAAAAASAAPAQGRPRGLLGLLRDPSGKPVADADLVFVPDPRPDVPALDACMPPPAATRGRPDAGGTFHLPADRPGTLLVATPAGLGALVAPCWPGRAVRVLLQPMAEVALESGETFTLWPALADGVHRHLPAATGRSIRLPAGRYEAWFASAAGFGWQRLELRSGERTVLRGADAALRLERRADATVHPEGFPQLELLGPERPECTLLGPAGAATLVTRWPALGRIDAGTPQGRGSAALPWPPPDGARTREQLALAVAGGESARAFLLARTARGGFRAVAEGAAAPREPLRLTLPGTPGDYWVLAIAGGAAPTVRTLAAARNDGHLSFAPGRLLDCSVLDPDGQPAADVTVLFVPFPGGPAAARATSDELGRLCLGPVDGGGVLRIDDPRYANLEQPLDGSAVAATLRLAAGASLAGRVVDEDLHPAAGVVVTLRDPAGSLRPAERSMVSDAHGRFRFDGLPQGGRFLVLAQQVRGGATWSALLPAVAGTQALELHLAHEDPQLRPPGAGH